MAKMAKVTLMIGETPFINEVESSPSDYDMISQAVGMWAARILGTHLKAEIITEDGNAFRAAYPATWRVKLGPPAEDASRRYALVSERDLAALLDELAPTGEGFVREGGAIVYKGTNVFMHVALSADDGAAASPDSWELYSRRWEVKSLVQGNLEDFTAEDLAAQARMVEYAQELTGRLAFLQAEPESAVLN